MLQAERLRAAAAREAVAPAGAWADPQLTLGLMNRPVSGFGAAEPMTMNSLTLTQMVPWPGKLGAAREREDRLAAAAGFDADEAEARLVAEVRSVYYETAFMDRALAIMDDTRRLLRSFLDVSASMYRVGTGRQQDVLQAQVSVARMTEDLTAMTQGRRAMAARLNAMLDRPADVPVGALELPEADSALWSAERLLAAAESGRPVLHAAEARRDASDAGVRAAAREIWPDLMVAVGYGQRPQFGDMATVMVGVSLPVFAGRRQRPMQREQEAMLRMEEARLRALRVETHARLVELSAEAERARALGALYESSVLPQARAAVEASLSAYRVGSVDFMTLVDNQMTVNRYRVARVRLAADYARAVAGIEALLGGIEGSDR